MASAGAAASASASDFAVLQRVGVVVLAAWISDTPVSNVSRFCSADMRFCDWAELPKPDNNFVGLPLDSIDRATRPSQKMFVPASEMMMGKVPP